jgi:Mrp family chromosome partitioning ATPase
MFGEIGKKMEMGRTGIMPVESLLGIRLISLGFVLDEEEIVTWFQEKRRNATEEFIAHVDHGENVDYLLVDLPPGTSSDAVNIMEYIPDLDGMILVTNPTNISQIVARRATIMAIEGGVNVLGIIENLSGYVCTKCNAVVDVMLTGGGKRLAEQCDVPYLGPIPIDPNCSKSCDEGVPYVYKYPESPATKATLEIVDKIQEVIEKGT